MWSIDSILSDHLSPTVLKFVNNLVYGESQGFKSIELPPRTRTQTIIGSSIDDLEEKGYSLNNSTEPVRLGLFQNAIIKPTTDPILEQKKALHELGRAVIARAHQCGVQIFCFQELWTMPLGICTQEKLPWVEFAEDAYNGETTRMLVQLSKEYDMVIVSPIPERDSNGFLWNSAVVIDAGGEVLGVYRKNHIPISGRHSETYYFNPSESGVPVFQTKYARIGVSICYDRHHPQNWYMNKLNGAQIVFNPAASIARFGEPLWQVEGRAAGAAHKYYVGSINRVGLESFGNQEAGPFFGSSYVSGPDGQRTKGLSNDKNGLLVVDVNLRSCGNYSEPWVTAEEKYQLRQFASEVQKYNVNVNL